MPFVWHKIRGLHQGVRIKGIEGKINALSLKQKLFPVNFILIQYEWNMSAYFSLPCSK